MYIDEKTKVSLFAAFCVAPFVVAVVVSFSTLQSEVARGARDNERQDAQLIGNRQKIDENEKEFTKLLSDINARTIRIETLLRNK